ncbi:hypothetical protein YB2330_001830 [Saitoella coloradoensis]
MPSLLPPNVSKTSRKKILASYLFDYALLVFFLVVFTTIDAIQPHHQQFTLTNESLWHRFAEHETVPVWLLIVVSVIAPGAIIIIWSLLFERKERKLWEAHCGCLGLALSFAGAVTITACLKNAVGRPRPDFLARCQPDPSRKRLDNDYSMYDATICTVDLGSRIMREAFRSFPSGHSSTAFAGLTYLSFWVGGKTNVLDTRGNVWKCAVVLIPTLAAGLVAASRIMDQRHHGFDVLFGSFIGWGTAWAAYRQYYPALTVKDVVKNEAGRQGHLPQGAGTGSTTAVRVGEAYPVRTWGTPQRGDLENQEDQEGLGGYEMDREESIGYMSVGRGGGVHGGQGLAAPSAAYARAAGGPAQYDASIRSKSPLH